MKTILLTSTLKSCRKCEIECPQNAIIAVNFPPRKAKPAEETAPKAETAAPKAPKAETVAPKAEPVVEQPKAETPAQDAPKAEA